MMQDKTVRKEVNMNMVANTSGADLAFFMKDHKIN